MSAPTVAYIYYLLRFTEYAACIAMIVFGILVVINKEKQTKILGISFIISGVSSLLGSAFTTVRRFVGVAVFTRMSYFSAVISMLTSAAVMFCICWYIHKTYGKKYIYIPVFAIMAVNRIATFIVNICLNKAMKGGISGLWMSLVSQVNGFVSGTAVAVVIFIPFYLNRNKEKIIPHTWIFRIVMYVHSTIVTLLTIYSYVLMLRVIKKPGKLPSGLSIINNSGNVSDSVMLLQIFGALIELAFPVYVFIRLKRANAGAAAQQTDKS